jgi:hypothetical protein
MLTFKHYLLIVTMLASLWGCGGGGAGATAVASSNPTTVKNEPPDSGGAMGGVTTTMPALSTTTLIGGSVQGNALTLTGEISTLAGRTYTYSGLPSINGAGLSATFSNMGGLTTDGANLYVAEDHVIRKIVIATGLVSNLAGTATYGYLDGSANQARFNGLGAITTDGTYIYAWDAYNSRIRKIELSTGTVSTLAGGSTATSAVLSGDIDGVGASAKFGGNIWDMTTDGVNVYAAQDFVIRKIVILTGEVTTLPQAVSLYQGYLTMDKANIYTMSSVGEVKKYVLSSGSYTSLGLDLGGAFGLTSDGANLYILNGGHTVINAMNISSGSLTKVAGIRDNNGYVDGSATVATLGLPHKIVTDGKSLFFLDEVSGPSRFIRAVK